MSDSIGEVAAHELAAVFEALGASLPGCWHQHDALERYRRALRDGDAAIPTVDLLRVVADLRLDPDNPTAPLDLRAAGAAPTVDVLVDGAVQRLVEIVGLIPSLDLRARIRDIIFLRRRHDDNASLAARAYVDAAHALLKTDYAVWDRPSTRLRRAKRIAGATRDVSLRDDVRDAIHSVVTNAELEPRDRMQAAAILLEWKGEHARTSATVCEALADDYVSTLDEHGFNWDWVRACLDVAAKALREAGDPDAQRRILAKRADTFVQHADWLEKHPAVSRHLIVDLLKRGVQAQRDRGASREEVASLHARLLRAQNAVAEEMKSYEVGSVNLADLALAAIKAVSGRSFGDALLALVEITPVPKRASAFAMTKELRDRNPLRSLITLQVLDKKGRLVRSRNGDDEIDDAEVFAQTRLEQQVRVRGRIDPARRTIIAEHPALLTDWFDFLEDRALAPPERRRSIAIGLAAGLRGDGITAASVLVPQLEHMIRCIVRGRGGVTATLSPGDGTQQEGVLSPMLLRPELLKVLGEDLVFDLRGLLDREGGANLRNHVAHGLHDDDELESGDVLYLWFTVLRLIVLVDRAETSGVPNPEDGQQQAPTTVDAPRD